MRRLVTLTVIPSSAVYLTSPFDVALLQAFVALLLQVFTFKMETTVQSTVCCVIGAEWVRVMHQLQPVIITQCCGICGLKPVESSVTATCSRLFRNYTSFFMGQFLCFHCHL